MADKTKVEQADSGGHYHKFLKRKKARYERRKAKKNPEAKATYGKYRGYET